MEWIQQHNPSTQHGNKNNRKHRGSEIMTATEEIKSYYTRFSNEVLRGIRFGLMLSIRLTDSQKKCVTAIDDVMKEREVTK
jgi:hypothetical protein